MRINSLRELRPGDIMISGMSTAPTKLLVYGGQFLLREQFRIGEFVAGHAGVIDPELNLVEAMPHGARVRRLTPSDWSVAHAYFRLPEDYPGQHVDAANIAQLMIGTPYSFASYAYLAAYLGGFQPEWLAKRINRRHDPYSLRTLSSGHITTAGLPVEAICSVLSDQAWTLTGKKVVRGTSPQVVTPGMLAKSLWTTDGIIMGGAAFV